MKVRRAGDEEEEGEHAVRRPNTVPLGAMVSWIDPRSGIGGWAGRGGVAYDALVERAHHVVEVALVVDQYHAQHRHPGRAPPPQPPPPTRWCLGEETNWGKRDNVGWGGGNAPAKDVEALQPRLFGGRGAAGVRGGGGGVGKEGRRRRWRLLDIVGVLHPIVGNDHGVAVAFPPGLLVLHLQLPLPLSLCLLALGRGQARDWPSSWLIKQRNAESGRDGGDDEGEEGRRAGGLPAAGGLLPTV